jgi:phosphoglycerate dehydrogenase-like enzyme
MRGSFHVGFTPDGAHPDGSTIFGDIGVDRLKAAGITWSLLDAADETMHGHRAVAATDLDGVNAVLSFGHAAFDRTSVEGADGLRLIARFGAGYETIDVNACTEAGVIVTNTPAAIRRPLGLAALTMLLAVGHKLRMKDRLTREGRWDDRERFRGAGFDGKTLGIIGFGSTGSELARLAAPLGMTIIGNTRSGRSAAADELDVSLVSLDELLDRSDYVVVMASLNPSTYHLIDQRALARMKPTAFLINMARGAIVDQDALRSALLDERIAGAGLDVFDPEPIDGHPGAALTQLDGGLHPRRFRVGARGGDRRRRRAAAGDGAEPRGPTDRGLSPQAGGTELIDPAKCLGVTGLDGVRSPEHAGQGEQDRGEDRAAGQ